MSNYKFSFCVSIHFLQKQWGEAVKISIELNLSDHVLTNLYTLDIALRSLTRIVVRPERVKRLSLLLLLLLLLSIDLF